MPRTLRPMLIRYYVVSVTAFVAVVTLVGIAQIDRLRWLLWLAIGILVLWMIFAVIYIRRYQVTRRRH